jgi:DNA (cytosine-5)-methyltransferase 1
MTAFYNEIDAYAAQWLRNLIEAGHIAPGVVDERDIREIRADELAGYTQCHWFAGVGVWSLALRRGGWADDRPVWTGSCPCQPFSAAGKGAGFSDERHLWPAFYRLISECRPDVVFGEQVEGPAGRVWLDAVYTDLENSGYAAGAVVIPAASVGAPHIRHRTYWVAHASEPGLAQQQRDGGVPRQTRGTDAGQAVERDSAVGGLADADEEQRGRRAVTEELQSDRQAGGRLEGDGFAQPDFEVGGVADAVLERQFEHAQRDGEPLAGVATSRGDDAGGRGGLGWPGPVSGVWSSADWLFCRDGKFRPVESGTFPLAHGAPARVGRLRAYGNAICAQQAQAFIEAYLDCAAA